MSIDQHLRGLRAAACLTALLAALPAYAGPQLLPAGPPAFYVGGEGGWTSLDKQQASIPSVAGKSGPQVWKDGFNLGARGGIAWGPWRLEGEFRYLENGDDTIARHPAHGNRTAYALLANAIYDFDIGLPFSPHIGGGLGAVALHDSVSVPSIGVGEATGVTDWEFGYQGIAGIRYDIAPTVSLDIDYRYLAAAGASFATRPTLVIDGTPVGNRIATSGYRSHSVVASLRLLFPPPAPPPAAASPR